MVEATAPAREPRYWKITVNPEECPRGAWEVSVAAGLALLGQSGGETNYAVCNLQRVHEGDWLIAYTPQEGAYTVGGIGQVTRGYRCEEGTFDHPWDGPVRRSVGVAWQPGACRIEDLVKDGRFRKGKISRVLDEVMADEFACVRERVLAAGCPPSPASAAMEGIDAPGVLHPEVSEPDGEEQGVLARRPWLVGKVPAVAIVAETKRDVCFRETVELSEVALALAAGHAENSGTPGSAAPPRSGEPAADCSATAPAKSRAALGVVDPSAEPPPLPQFFLEWAEDSSRVISDGLDRPSLGTNTETRRRREESEGSEAENGREASAASSDPASARLRRAWRRNRHAEEPQALPTNLGDAAASLRRSREAALLASLGCGEGDRGVLEFGFPTGNEEEPFEAETFDLAEEFFAVPEEGAEPFEVRVGSLGWTGVFRREVELGRPCSLLLRGPQYSFLNMAQPGAALRGLPLFALFAIGAMSAPGKEAHRGGATFIFRGRRSGGEYAVEVRPRQRRPAFRSAASN
jgi:hypothetical protein